MTDLELIRRWPHAACLTCGEILRPSIRQDGTLLTSHNGKGVWRVCSSLGCSMSSVCMRSNLEDLSQNTDAVLDMSHWIEKIHSWHENNGGNDEDMTQPLSGAEIMALGKEQRNRLIQLRILFKSLTESGLDPARIRATIATYTTIRK